VIEHLEAVTVVTRGGSPAFVSVIAKFTARDTASSIERTQYSVDGSDWILVAPKGGITDALEEQYEITLSGLSAGEHTIIVRAYDRFENVGSAKTTVTVPAAKL
jgi:hypothetical protein